MARQKSLKTLVSKYAKDLRSYTCVRYDFSRLEAARYYQDRLASKGWFNLSEEDRQRVKNAILNP